MTLQYVVHGTDDDAVGDLLNGLAEQHWSYMDGHADRLVARGPTLSPDGEAHTGSIHVIEAADLEEAQRFAFQEPYCVAGVYASVTVTPWLNALGGTMWDRPPSATGQVSTLARVSWPSQSAVPHDLRQRVAELDGRVFGGLLVDAAGPHGLVVALDDDQDGAARSLAGLGLPATATSTFDRWRRGGRHQT